MPKSLGRTSVAAIHLLLLALMMAACPMDGPSPIAARCRQAGGLYETRPHPDQPGALTDYCTFSEEYGCYGEQVRDGACLPPDSNVPISPLMPLDASAPLPYTEWMTIPVSLDALTSAAPLIVVAEIGPVVRYHNHIHYGPDGALQERGTNTAGYLLPAKPATDFPLAVEEVLRDDGTVTSGKPIILRMAGIMTGPLHERTLTSAFPYSNAGDRHLFLLTPNPDGESYGLAYGPWSRLLLPEDATQADAPLRVSSGEQPPLQFANDASTAPITLNSFLASLQK